MKLFCPECRSSYDDSVSVCPKDGTRLYRLDPADDPLVGAVLDERFRVDFLIGQGGMGAVYRGMQLSINRQVAIKVLRSEFVDREIALERFFREAKVISEMTHPNIVRLIEFGQDKERDLLYLVMELVESSSLSDLLKEGRFKASFALEVAYQVCGALTEPHANDVIHRDLKPDNLLIGARSDGTLETKVLDFGIARALQRNTRLTQTGMICGTPAYMAPEQSRDRTVDPRTDLYALGVMLYEMLAGRPPFLGQSSLQIMLKHIQEDPPSLREVLPAGALPEAIEQLVYQLIAKDPAARPASARQVRTQIERIRADFDLEPVRLDTQRDKDVLFADWVMPAMPTSDQLERGNTLGLVKETDLFAKADDDQHSQADTVAENAPTQGITGDSDDMIDELVPDTEFDQVAATTPIAHAAGPKVRAAARGEEVADARPAKPGSAKSDSAKGSSRPAGVANADASGAIEQQGRASASDKRTGESRAVDEAAPSRVPAGTTTRPGDSGGGVSTRMLVSVALGVAVAVFGLSAFLFYLISDDGMRLTDGDTSATSSTEANPGKASGPAPADAHEPGAREDRRVGGRAGGAAEAVPADADANGESAQSGHSAAAAEENAPDEKAGQTQAGHTHAESTSIEAPADKDQAGKEEPAPSSAQKTAGVDQPVEDKPVEDKPAEDKPAEDKPAEEPAADKSAAAKKPAPEKGTSTKSAPPDQPKPDNSSASDTDLEAELEALVNDDE